MSSREQLISETLNKKLPSIDGAIRTWDKKSTLEKNVYKTNYDNIDLYFYFQPANSNKLLITFTDGSNLQKSRKDTGPRFSRWKYSSWIDANVISIDDPTAWIYNFMPGWFYGPPKCPFFMLVVNLIHDIVSCLKIDNPEIILFGSSSGGVAAIYTSRYLKYASTVIAINSQLCPNKHVTYNELMQLLRWPQEYSDPYSRNDVISIPKCRPDSKYIVLTNLASIDDYTNHYLPFVKFYKIPVSKGIVKQDNIISWLYYAPNEHPHRAQDWATFFPILELVGSYFDEITTHSQIKYLLKSFNELIYEHHRNIIERDILEFDLLLKNNIMNETVVKKANNYIKNHNPDFLIRLAQLYRLGIGVDIDLKHSESLLQIALKYDARASVPLYELYVSINTPESLKNAAKLAESQINCNSNVQLFAEMLGDMYLNGIYFNKDIRKAIDYYLMSVEDGNKRILLRLIELMEKTNDELYHKKAFELALTFHTNNPRITAHLAIMYRDGKGTVKDLNKAASYMKIAANSEIDWAKWAYFRLLWSIDTPESLQEMIKYGEFESNNNNYEIRARLAKAYRQGKGVTPNIKKSIELLESIPMGINPKWAKWELFDIYWELSDPQYDVKLISIIDYDPTDNDVNRISRLARMYLYGRGKEKDLKKSLELFNTILSDKNKPNWVEQEYYNIASIN